MKIPFLHTSHSRKVLALALCATVSALTDLVTGCSTGAGSKPATRASGADPGLAPPVVLATEIPLHADFRAVQPAVAIIGRETRDSRGRKIGTVKALAVDVENGRLVEVILASPGALGFGERTVAVPPGALMFDPVGGVSDIAGAVLCLNVDLRKFKAAPDFAMSKWAEHCQSQRVAEVYRYYGQVPYFAPDGQPSASGNTATEPLGYVQRADKVMHLPVRNLQNELLGSVDNLLYNLTKGRVLHVIVLAPGVAQAKSVIPARALRFNAAHDTLLLDMSTAAFRNEPRFQWSQLGQGGFQQETYSNTVVAANEGVNTRQNMQEGSVNRYTPLAQGTSFRDIDLTYRIYAAMRADATLSQNAQAVEVGTVNGRVTLRGHVDTEGGKTAVGRIAATVALPENISNLLEVRALPPGITDIH